MKQTEIPRQAGPYRLGELLGRGGMGEVYRAYDERLSRWVAIKQVRPDKQGGPQARSRLLREARAAAGLAHPAIVQIFDILDNEDGCWIVMELVDGQTLASLLREGPLDVAVVARIGRQIAEGLAHAHELGIVHRDLKVENVMLSALGRTRILDFGLVKDLNETENTQTTDGVILGTLRAMSPEQALGRAVDSRSDLFSLGTLLYECLSGTRPFEASSAVATLQRVTSHDQEPLRELNPEVPPEISGLVDQLLEKQPEIRPSAAAVIDRLQKIERLLESVDSNTAADLVGEFRRGHPSSLEEGALADSTLGVGLGNASRKSLAFGRRIGISLLLALLVFSATVLYFKQEKEPNESDQPLTALGKSVDSSGVVTGIDLPETPFDRYKKGLAFLERHYRTGAVEEAIGIFEELIRMEPGHAGAFAGIARGRLMQFDASRDKSYLGQAMQAAEKAVELGSQLAVAHVSLGLVRVAAGDLEAAKGALDRSLVLDPKDSLAHIGMGRLEEAQGHAADAEEWFTKASQLVGARHLAFIQLGMLFYSQGRYEAATAAFTQSRELAPGDATTLRNLGASLHMQGQTEEAAAVLQESLVIEPRASVFNNLGTLFFFQGRYADAAQAFEKAVELGPNVYFRWANLGDAYRWLPGSEVKSREAFEVALELLADELETDPRSVNLLSRGALYHAKLEQCDESEAYSELLGTQVVESGAVFFRLGIATELCNHREQALEHLEQAIHLGYSREELTAEPELRSLRQDARFHRLVLGQ